MVSLTDLKSDDSYGDVPPLEFLDPWQQIADEIVQRAEVQDELESAPLELDNKYRLILVLRDVEGLSERETAEFLEPKKSTVKVRQLRSG